jgi:predicted ATPase
MLRHISDCGFGYSQIVSLILTFLTKYYRKEELYIVEEPETNLHPKLQSRLADFFQIFISVTNSRFLIETHSEYLIRKLQYLVAKGEFNPEDIVIYYIDDPDPAKRASGSPQVREITLDKNGRMSHDFGPGFFDEADNLAIQLFNLNQQSNN